ncbi:hypothetical protein SUDANB6_05577 [Streptomyces sp. enrichment culture]|uniref:hypothetical protein n=1 Tax=Streptomyces sp. enrichment culture TaxID=1795815 RepID=UPI003F57E66E
MVLLALALLHFLVPAPSPDAGGAAWTAVAVGTGTAGETPVPEPEGVTGEPEPVRGEDGVPVRRSAARCARTVPGAGSAPGSTRVPVRRCADDGSGTDGPSAVTAPWRQAAGRVPGDAALQTLRC